MNTRVVVTGMGAITPIGNECRKLFGLRSNQIQ